MFHKRSFKKGIFTWVRVIGALLISTCRRPRPLCSGLALVFVWAPPSAHSVRFLNWSVIFPYGVVAPVHFLFANGRYFARQHVSSLLCHCLGGSVYVNTHSLRIGGASFLAAINPPDYVIPLLDRWRSVALESTALYQMHSSQLGRYQWPQPLRSPVGTPALVPIALG